MTRKRLLIALLIAAVIEIPWFLYGMRDMKENAEKTVATVIAGEERKDTNAGRMSRLPVYEYYDHDGKRYTKVNTSEDLQPRFATAPAVLTNDDKTNIAAAFKNSLANKMPGDFFNKEQLGPLTVIISEQTGLEPMPVGEYLQQLVSRGAQVRDSQSQATGGAITGNPDVASDVAPVDAPIDAELPPIDEVPELNDAPVDTLADAPIDAPIDAPVELPPVDGAELPPTDEVTSLETEIASAEADLQADDVEAEAAAEGETVEEELAEKAEGEDGEEDEGESTEDGEGAEGVEGEDGQGAEELLEGDDDMFKLESIRKSLAGIRAQFEAVSGKQTKSELRSKLESIAGQIKSRVSSERKAEAALDAKLESIAAEIKGETKLDAKLESIAQDIRKSKEVDAKLESIAAEIRGQKATPVMESAEDKGSEIAQIAAQFESLLRKRKESTK